MNRSIAFAAALIALSLALSVTAQESTEKAEARKELRVPSDMGEATLEPRAKAQLETLDQFDVFTFFRFEDQVHESGISFVHEIVDDAGRDYKMVHYDHGNGVLTADVDGDGLQDLYFLTQLGANELWRNAGGGKFEDWTAKSGLGLGEKVSVTGAFADYDNDGDPDIFVTTVRMGNHLFENLGDGRFKDVTEEAGVSYVGHCSAAIFFDYDLDGRLDLYVSNVGVYTTSQRGRGGYYVGVDQAFSGHLFDERNEPNLLYRNLGPGEDGRTRFEEVGEEVGLADETWSGDASPVDLNGDRYPDLYVLNMQGDDRYYENVEGKRFVEKTAEYFPKTPWGSMGVKFFDYDNDGRQDLLLTDMHSDMSEIIGVEREKLKSRMQWPETQLQGSENNIFGNAFYRNLGPDGDGRTRFEEISDQVGAENYWPWGLSVGDLNADGWEDVFITSSMNYPFRYGVNTLLINNAGETFLDAEFILGAEPRRDRAVVKPWFELDCSGADKAHDHCQGLEGPVTVLGTLGTRSSVIVDLEGDGDLDVVTGEFNSEPQILTSDLAEQTGLHYLEVDLEGRSSNRDGLGAVVTVVAGGLEQTKVYDGQSGYLSQSSRPLYFGLGEAKKVNRVEVLWPSAVEQTLSEGIEINGRLVVVETSSDK